MRFVQTQIAGLLQVTIDWNYDLRGSFGRLFCYQEFHNQGLAAVFVQSSLSMSRKAGTLRGMHLQREPYAEVKLVHCVRGAIYDVIVDLRRDSPTYLQWQAFHLTEQGKFSLYIPKGCAHGFQTLADNCEVLYQMDTPYAPAYADGLRYDDPALNIAWPSEVTEISDKDRSWPLSSERSIG